MRKQIHKFEYKLILKKIYKIFVESPIGGVFGTEKGEVIKLRATSVEYDSSINSLALQSRKALKIYLEIEKTLASYDSGDGACDIAERYYIDDNISKALEVVKDGGNIGMEKCRYILAKMITYDGSFKISSNPELWKKDNAIGVWTSLLMSDKYKEEARYNLGLITLSNGDYDKSISIFKSVEEPYKKIAIKTIGLLLAFNGDKQGGRDNFAVVMSDIPPHVVKLLESAGVKDAD